MFLFKNSRNKITRIGLNLLVYSFVLCIVLLVASSYITYMYRLWKTVYQICSIGIPVGVGLVVVGFCLPQTRQNNHISTKQVNANSSLNSSSFVRLKEGYDGEFTEFYLNLCQENGTFVIKKISHHYNAGRTDLIKEIVVPESKNSKKKIVKFIAQKSLAFKWCTVSVDELLNNDKLMAFIESGLHDKFNVADNKNNVTIPVSPTKTENKRTNIQASAPTSTAFTMWETGVFFSNGWFVYYDGKGNNSIISHKRARAFEEGYQMYQASQDINRGGADYDVAYRNRGFTKKDGKYVYENFRVDNLIVGELAPIEKVLVIPERIGNVHINYIEREAFYAESVIEEVILHKNITEISESAFKGCINLKKAVIPNEHVVIGSSAFENTALFTDEKVFYINNTLIKVSDDYSGVLTIKGDTTSIAAEAAKNCKGITEIIFPEGLVSIGKYSFMGCSAVQSIVFPESLQVIGIGAFSECANLQNVSFPAFMDKIGSNSFGKCPLLEKVHLPDGITEVNGIFNGCIALKDVNIPDSVTMVSDFRDCELYNEYVNSSQQALYVGKWLIHYKPQEELCVREGTVGIAQMHWNNAKELCDLKLPDSLKYIGYSAFERASITSVVLPKNLEFIDTSAFRGSKLKKIVIPESVKKIEQWAFMDCEDIESITIKSADTEIVWPAITDRRDKKPIIIRAPYNSKAHHYYVHYKEKYNFVFKKLYSRD